VAGSWFRNLGPRRSGGNSWLARSTAVEPRTPTQVGDRSAATPI
jgi:hypothetical protein